MKLPTGGTAFYYEAVAQNLLNGEGFTYYPYLLVSFPPEIGKTFENLGKPISEIVKADRSTDTRLAVLAPLYRYPPGYSIYLFACHRLWGLSPLPVVLIQILLNGLAAAMICRLAFIYFENLNLAAAAGILAAAWPFTLLNSLSYEPTSLLYATVTGCVWAVTEYLKSKRTGFLLLAGILSGLSAILRTDSILAAFGVSLALLLSRSLDLRGKIRTAGILLLLTAAVIAPWWIRNAMVFHRFVPLSCGLGVNLMQGIGRYMPESRFPKDDRDIIIEDMGEEHYKSPMNTHDNCYPDGIEREERRVRIAKAYISQHPLDFLGSCLKRAPDLFFVGASTVQMRVAQGASESSIVRRFAVLILTWIEPVAFVLALIGLIRTRRAWAAMTPAILTVVLYAIGHLPLSVEPRYFKPVWPILLIFSAAAFLKKSAPETLDKQHLKIVA